MFNPNYLLFNSPILTAIINNHNADFDFYNQFNRQFARIYTCLTPDN